VGEWAGFSVAAQSEPDVDAHPQAACANAFKARGRDLSEHVRWAIIGAGTISQTFAAGVAASRTGELITVGSRTPENAESFRAR
jgi:ornithine cyclodeaminase/alanine dehydrogenase-like protein (mu-crystallin family)